MNITYYLLNLREFFVKSFQTRIVGIIDKNYSIEKNSVIIYLINFIPFFITSFIFFLFSISYIYVRDGIIFYSESKKVNITPCILDFKIIKEDREICVKESITSYFSNVPLKVIFENEKVDVCDTDEIKIKYLNSGKFIEKILNYKKIKLFSKGNLLN